MTRATHHDPATALAKPGDDRAPANGTRALTIRVRIVLLVLAVLLPAAAALAWLLAQDLKHARATAHDRVDRVTTHVVRNVQHALDVSDVLLGRLAARPAVRALDPGACNSSMADVFAATPGIVGLEIRDLSGRAVCACDTTGARRQADPVGAWLQHAARAQGLTASQPYVSATTGQRLLVLAQPVHAADGTVVGVVAAAMDLVAFGNRLLSNAPDDAAVLLSDLDGSPLLSSSHAASFAGAQAWYGALEPGTSTLAELGFNEATGHDGVQRLFSSATSPELGWRISAGLPTSEVFADYRSAMLRTLVLGTTVLVAALTAAWRMGLSITTPIAELQRTARRVAEGDGNERAAEQGPPELRAVMHDVNRMLDALALSRARLQGVFDSASDAIVSADASQRVVLANLAAARLFGVPLDRLIGSPLNDLIPHRHRVAHTAAVETFGKSDLSMRPMGHRPSLVALRADGTEFPIEASISHIELGNQRIYTAVLRDITERQRELDVLADSRATLAAALSSMTDAVYVCDLHGRLVENNGAFARFYRFAGPPMGVEHAQALADTVEFCFPDGSAAQRAQHPDERARRGEAGSGIEYHLRHRGTGEQWIGSFNFAPLRVAGGQIFGGVVTARDVTALRRTQRELEASHTALRRLVGAQDHAREHERKRIARELHDDLQQTLAAIKLEAVALAQASSSTMAVALARIDDLAGVALQSTRRIIEDLRPQLLEELGLVAALDAMAVQFARRTGVPCSLVVEPPLAPEPEIEPDIATCLFRVAQECLNNVAKHAQASAVQIRLAAVDGGHLLLEVKDNGRGVAPADHGRSRSFGLLGMRERVLAAGGTLRIHGSPGAGTCIEIQVPASPRDNGPDSSRQGLGTSAPAPFA